MVAYGNNFTLSKLTSFIDGTENLTLGYNNLEVEVT